MTVAAGKPAPVAPATAGVDASTDAGPILYGVLDVVRGDRIAGWAIDRRDSAAALDVEIRREGRTVGVSRADRHRRDLEQTGVGTGRYGFVCKLDPPIEPGFEFTVTATARAADGAAVELRRPASKAATDPDRRLAERTFEALARLGDGATRMPEDDLQDIVRRIEVAQARIEAALTQIEPPPQPSQLGLKLVLALSVGLAATSLAVGIVSMWPA